jgi:hypothetical protein
MSKKRAAFAALFIEYYNFKLVALADINFELIEDNLILLFHQHPLDRTSYGEYVTKTCL